MPSLLEFRGIVLACAISLLLPLGAAAQKMQSAVSGTWQGAPSSIPLYLDVDLVLHLQAREDASSINAVILPSDGIAVINGSTEWSGALARGDTIDLPVTVRFLANGDWTLGARITNERADAIEVSSAVLNVVAANGVAKLGSDPHALMKMAAPLTAADLAALGIGYESAVPLMGTAVAPATASVVSGTIKWSDPEGHTLPVRRAYVEIADGVGTVLVRTSTNDTGGYSAAVNADSVRVTVYSRDFDNIRVVVFPLGQPTERYILQSALTPIAGAATTINITSAATVRGTPGAPSSDSIAARGFAVYDAMLTFWFQATAILGRNMQQALANFPESTAAGSVCGTSCYASSNQQMYILRDDAFDWDVLGHEFFHFTTNRGALRQIDSSLGGDHSGGTAIGQNDGTGHLRTRDEGMRLAWSEGLATAMALLLEVQPPSTFGFPAILNVGDSTYHDTEDSLLTVSGETPPSRDGFGAENSVLGLLWDLYDTAADSEGGVTDTMSGVDGSLLWAAINVLLPANPCDRVDRLWTGVVGIFGMTAPTTMEVAKLLVMNNMAPEATGPADNSSVPGTVAPTFRWTQNGDPSANHRNNHFYLVFSRDDFQGHLVLISVPALDATTYKPTDAEWQAVQAGGNPGQTYKGMVVAERQDSPQVPAGWYWYSNIRSLVPRSLEAIITWAPLGADVDLHLANPTGTDIAYYNLSTSWGFLDRDCISTCAQEVLSVTSLPLRGTYRLFVHYYSDHDKGPATVHAVVRSGSQILLDTTFVLSSTGDTQTLTSVSVADERPAPIDADKPLDPALLPQKKPN